MGGTMRVMVTGGAGFIGSHLVEKLVEFGYKVVVLDILRCGNKIPREILRKIRLVQGDVRDRKTVEMTSKGCEMIFHFAAVLGVDVVADNPVDTMETEALGMANITRAAILHGARKVVYASTSGVYGKAAIAKAVDEEIEVSPRSSYSIAKRYNEIYLKSFHQEKGLQSVALRFFNVYGPRQDTRMVIPRFIEQAIAGKPLAVYGTGKQTRDFTYVDDVVSATIKVAERVEGCEIINVCDGREYTIADLAREIIAICKSESKIVFVETPAGRYDFEVDRRCGSNEKLGKLVGSVPETNLRTGLGRTIEMWRQEHRNASV
jgi:nucleoside-diphosphate-sugar epimerase